MLCFARIIWNPLLAADDSHKRLGWFAQLCEIDLRESSGKHSHLLISLDTKHSSVSPNSIVGGLRVHSRGRPESALTDVCMCVCVCVCVCVQRWDKNCGCRCWFLRWQLPAVCSSPSSVNRRRRRRRHTETTRWRRTWRVATETHRDDAPVSNQSCIICLQHGVMSSSSPARCYCWDIIILLSAVQLNQCLRQGPLTGNEEASGRNWYSRGVRIPEVAVFFSFHGHASVVFNSDFKISVSVQSDSDIR